MRRLPPGEVWNCAEATPLHRVGRIRRDRHRCFDLAPLVGAVTEPVGGVASMVAEPLAPLAAVQVEKPAVTRQTNVPSPGTSEQPRAVIRVDALVPQASLQSRARRGAALDVVFDGSRAGRSAGAPTAWRSSSTTETAGLLGAPRVPTAAPALPVPPLVHQATATVGRARRASRAQGRDGHEVTRAGSRCWRLVVYLRPFNLGLRVGRVVDGDRHVLAVVLVQAVVQQADGEAQPRADGVPEGRHSLPTCHRWRSPPGCSRAWPRRPSARQTCAPPP